MPLHDWTRVEASAWHDFHSAWIIHLKEALNAGILPKGYYAQAEQHALSYIADVLTLHDPARETSPRETGGVSVLEAPPQVSLHLSARASYKTLRKTLVVRRVTGHRIVGLVEILSPGNKDGLDSVEQFVTKAADSFRNGLHFLLVDPFPHGKHDPHGMHAEIWRWWSGETYEAPQDRQLTLASYACSGPTVDAYLEHMAVGTAIPAMPLFLSAGRYVSVPLESTYEQAFQGTPEYYRELLSN
jgi:hypothetical protein